MKKLLVPLMAVAVLTLAVPAAFAEWELGLGPPNSQMMKPPSPLRSAYATFARQVVSSSYEINLSFAEPL